MLSCSRYTSLGPIFDKVGQQQQRLKYLFNFTAEIHKSWLCGQSGDYFCYTTSELQIKRVKII